MGIWQVIRHSDYLKQELRRVRCEAGTSQRAREYRLVTKLQLCNASPRSSGFRLFIVLFIALMLNQPAQAQFFDPNNTLILNTLREISTRHHFALQEQRVQTAKMIEQLRQFYDTYTLLRNDIEFTQSLYRDFKAIDNLDLTQSYSMTNFIINGDRVDYWFPGLTGDVQRTAMDLNALANNSDAIRETYESFSMPIDGEDVPADAELRRQNALNGQQFFSEALFEYALKCQVLAKTYDSLAVELHKQVTEKSNRYTPAERTQLLVEAVKLRDLSNSYYEKYLKLARQAHNNALNMHDEKRNFLQSKGNWKALQKQVNKTSAVRYGFFDIIRAPFE